LATGTTNRLRILSPKAIHGTCNQEGLDCLKLDTKAERDLQLDKKRHHRIASGTDVMIFLNFRKMAFFAQTTASFCKKLILTLVL
jgi:hypothetical protein